jgi:hypothetical protein
MTKWRKHPAGWLLDGLRGDAIVAKRGGGWRAWVRLNGGHSEDLNVAFVRLRNAKRAAERGLADAVARTASPRGGAKEGT